MLLLPSTESLLRSARSNPNIRNKIEIRSLRMSSSSTRVDTNRILTCTAFNSISGAMLGPNLDSYHSAFRVLKYHSEISVAVGDSVLLRTAAFVPPLFGLAGAIIGGLYLVLDQVLETQPTKRRPRWPDIWYGISFFTFVYWLSGLLAGGYLYDLSTIHSIMALSCVASWAIFDGSKTGIIVTVMTAIGGPAIELFLINKLHLYTYLQADWFGIASWIPWVYGAGAPAVGNLSRGFSSYLLTDKDAHA